MGPELDFLNQLHKSAEWSRHRETRVKYFLHLCIGLNLPWMFHSYCLSDWSTYEDEQVVKYISKWFSRLQDQMK